jgi:hypothetical protein
LTVFITIGNSRYPFQIAFGHSLLVIIAAFIYQATVDRQ